MRRLILILMIALLPLRGWMGEVMATEMSAMNLIASQSINTPATDVFHSKINEYPSVTTHAQSAMPATCEMDDTSKLSQSCTHCQACHAAALVTSIQINSDPTTHSPAPRACVSLFASANLALSQKPPIL